MNVEGKPLVGRGRKLMEVDKKVNMVKRASVQIKQSHWH